MRTTEIGKAFAAQALNYEAHAPMQTEIGERLFERLDYLKMKPRYVLDLGGGPGIFAKRLQQYYPKATVVSLDLAYPMLQVSQQKQSFFKRKWCLVQANMLQLPFASNAFDLIFANQVIHWAESLPLLFSELNRVMQVGGCLMFSTLGPDTFHEFKLPHGPAHSNVFVDMHDVGDMLLREFFVDPVVDMEKLTAQYVSVAALFHALKCQGVKNIHPQRNRGLTGKAHWQQFKQHIQGFQTAAGKIPLTYEVIYGHAWRGEQRRLDAVIESVLPFPTLVK